MLEAPNKSFSFYYGFHLFARVEASFLLLLGIQCRRCKGFFCVCRSCWRGQAYCCDECRVAAQRHNHREVQRRYRQTPKGKKAHREAENRRRYGLSKKIQKNMDDASSTVLPPWCMTLLVCAKILIIHAKTWFDKTGRCHFCGCSGTVVDEFPRRGYGSGNCQKQVA